MQEKKETNIRLDNKMNQTFNKMCNTKGVILLIFVITALRIYHLSLEQFNLFFDEAQYWFWSKTFDWGYYSKPPMVSWLIGLTTSICGDGEFCVRISSPILHMITAIAVYFTAYELYERKIAFYSALSYITLPAVSVSSAVVSTDSSLLMFWALSLLFFVKAIKHDCKKYWIFAGIAAGLGMMSKYNMLLFLFSAILYLILSKENRRYLVSIKFWGAAILAFIIFLPNIIWNFQNGFVSFFHTQDNANITGFVLHPGEMMEFIGAQFGVFGPVFFATLLFIILKLPLRKIKEKREEDSLLLSFILPMLAVIVAISLLSRAHANWAAPIYVPATILVVAWLINSGRKKWVLISLAIHITAAILLTNFYLIAKIPGIEITGSKTDILSGKIKDPFKRVHGWRQLGEGVATLKIYYPDSVLLTDSRKIHSELLYYVNPFPLSAVKWNPGGKTGDHFELTTDINKAGTKNFLLITLADDISGISPYFENAEKVGNIEIKPYKDYSIDYYAYYLEGFRGY